jgi:hypothetical protein
MSLYSGCKARRGSVRYCGYLYQEYNNPFWSTLGVLAGSTDPARIMFVGSLFGGTGASGVPTLARLFNEAMANRTNYKIGLTLMAPYFYLNDCAKKDWKKDEIKVDFTQFGFQSKMAVNYYMLSDVLPEIDCIQVAGNYEQEMYDADRNGNPREVLNEGDDPNHPQDNPSVPTELAAAIGIMRFFTDQWETGRVRSGKGRPPDWGVFPEANNVRVSLQRLERFCVLSRHYFSTIATKADDSKAPTFIKELWSASERGGADWKAVWTSADEGLGNVLEFSKVFLRWYLDQYNNGLGVLAVPRFRSELYSKALRGQTAGINLHGAKGSRLIGKVNNTLACYLLARRHLQHKNPYAEAYTLALMGACDTAKHRAGHH